MTIEFCPKCGSMLIPKKQENKVLLKCSNCEFSKESTNKLIGKNKIPREKQKGEGVMKEENPLADYKNICKKCGYDKAQILDLGVFYSDEDNLILLKCGKCGWSERIGRKVS